MKDIYFNIRSNYAAPRVAYAKRDGKYIQVGHEACCGTMRMLPHEFMELLDTLTRARPFVEAMGRDDD